MFLQILQISQESTYVGVSFLQRCKPSGLQSYYKSPTQVLSCEIWEIRKNTYFEEHLNDCLCIDYFTYIDFYNLYSGSFWFLQITSSLLRNYNNRTNDAWGGFLWKSISLNKIFSFWKLKISFTEMFHESIKKQFNWDLMERYTLKLTLN